MNRFFAFAVILLSLAGGFIYLGRTFTSYSIFVVFCAGYALAMAISYAWFLYYDKRNPLPSTVEDDTKQVEEVESTPKQSGDVMYKILQAVCVALFSFFIAYGACHAFDVQYPLRLRVEFTITLLAFILSCTFIFIRDKRKQ